MPAILLPRTAAPFAPRAPPTVVLDTVVNPWLTQTLKRVNRLKRPLNSVPQHLKCLTEILSGPNAMWNLCSLMVPRAPSAQIDEHSNPVTDALLRYQFIHVQSYVVSVDLVHSHEIAFKLTKETIASLVEYHKDIYLADQSAATWHWTEKESAVKKLHEDFVQAINRFVFRTDKMALEGIEDDGAGELLCGQSENVRNLIMDCFLPLLPPPPRIVDVRAPQTPTIPSSPGWWAPTPPMNHAMAPVESWKVLPSNSPVTTAPMSSSMATSSMPSVWGYGDMSGNNYTYGTSMSTNYGNMVTTAGYQPSTTAATASASYPSSLAASSSGWWTPQTSPSPVQQQQQLFPTTSAGMMPSLPLPTMYSAQPCSTSVGYGGFTWDAGRFMDYATTM